MNFFFYREHHKNPTFPVEVYQVAMNPPHELVVCKPHQSFQIPRRVSPLRENGFDQFLDGKERCTAAEELKTCL